MKSTIVTLLGSLGCASTAPPPAEPTAAATAAPAETPSAAENTTEVVRLGVINPAADEGESWDIELRRDGSFGWVYTTSDGASDIVERCEGRLDPTTVDPWFARVQREATLAERPPQPRWRFDGTDPDHHFVIALHVEESPASFADPAQWRTEVESWFRTIRDADRTCE